MHLLLSLSLAALAAAAPQRLDPSPCTDPRDPTCTGTPPVICNPETGICTPICDPTTDRNCLPIVIPPRKIASRQLCDPRFNPNCSLPPICSPDSRTCTPLCDPTVNNCDGLSIPRISRRHALEASCDPRHEICTPPGGPGTPICDPSRVGCVPPGDCIPGVDRNCPIIVCPRENPWCRSKMKGKRGDDCDPRREICTPPGGPGSGPIFPCNPRTDRGCVWPPCDPRKDSRCPIFYCPSGNEWCSGEATRTE